ncbi:unnamed protein product [Pleuronectes platessa]|uniref:Secreted protein n=1 Tax=Pleuronectes platessa TaxID=8262 RepID=A0A9N7UY23_PLEPL|nr:unnamed protein product [Pleuronectes platessa]
MAAFVSGMCWLHFCMVTRSGDPSSIFKAPLLQLCDILQALSWSGGVMIDAVRPDGGLILKDTCGLTGRAVLCLKSVCHRGATQQGTLGGCPSSGEGGRAGADEVKCSRHNKILIKTSSFIPSSAGRGRSERAGLSGLCCRVADRADGLGASTSCEGLTFRFKRRTSRE